MPAQGFLRAVWLAPPASALVAAWGKTRGAAVPPALLPPPPARVSAPPGLAAPAAGVGFAEEGDEGVPPPQSVAPSSTLDLALTCLREALQQGRGPRSAYHPLLGSLSDHTQGPPATTVDLVSASSEAPQTTLNLALECLLEVLQHGRPVPDHGLW